MKILISLHYTYFLCTGNRIARRKSVVESIFAFVGTIPHYFPSNPMIVLDPISIYFVQKFSLLERKKIITHSHPARRQPNDIYDQHRSISDCHPAGASLNCESLKSVATSDVPAYSSDQSLSCCYGNDSKHRKHRRDASRRFHSDL